MKEYPKIIKTSKNSQQNNSETATNDWGKIYISRKRAKIYWWIIIL